MDLTIHLHSFHYLFPLSLLLFLSLSYFTNYTLKLESFIILSIFHRRWKYFIPISYIFQHNFFNFRTQMFWLNLVETKGVVIFVWLLNLPSSLVVYYFLRRYNYLFEKGKRVKRNTSSQFTPLKRRASKKKEVNKAYIFLIHLLNM